MSNLDPRIEAIRVKYKLERSDFWELPQKKGTWIAKHAALEVAAVEAGIIWNLPQVLEADGPNKSAAVCVSGVLGDRIEWSIGEASPANNKNAYPFAMSEKRGKDRVILKLLGIHGLAYSEDEADDFKEPRQSANAAPDGPISTEQFQALAELLQRADADIPRFCKAYKIKLASELPASKLADATAALNRKITEQSKVTP